MYAQLGLYPEILPYLIWHRIRIIHLVRRNHLDVLLSYTIKAKVGQAHLLAGQAAPEDLRVEMNTKDLVKKMGRLQKKQNLARRLLAWSRLPHLEIAYEDLLSDPAHFDWILNFLAVEPGENSQPSSLVKIRRGGHREVISNYDEVKEVLASSQFASLLE
jgi:LPS sulfotransferase NodH